MKLATLVSLITVALVIPSLHAVDLKIDINERSTANNVPANTEGGFLPLAFPPSPTGNLTTPLIGTFGAQTVTITPTGTTAAGTIADRKRTSPTNNGSFTQQAVLQDFIFAIYNATTNADAGFDITIAGLEAGKEYSLTIWSFDTSSGGTRVSDWKVNGDVAVDDYTFDGRQAPATNQQYQINFNGIADVAGQILVTARRDTTCVDTAGAASHGVFLNALWIRDLTQDADTDGIPDGWEDAHGLDKAVNDAALDPDNDLLSNLDEFKADTDPQDPDSDNDTLLDSYEKRTGTWTSPTETGTNPLVADTDGDGLNDAVEKPDLPWLSALQPGTDPNRYDTDGDGFSDNEEIQWPVSPKDNQQFPNPAAGATLAVDVENTAILAQPGFETLIGPGTAASALVEAVYGSYNVSIAAAGSTTLESRDRAAAAGGMGFNPLFRDFIFAQSSDLDEDGMDITVTGLAPLTVYPVTLWAWDPTSTGTARHSTWLASDGNGAPVVKVPLYSLEGAAVPTSHTDRRMQFEAKTDSTGKLIIQGRKEPGYTASTINVFLNGFIIGAPIPQGPPIVITGLGPVTPLGMTLTWTSQDAATYKVEASPDLSIWTTLINNVDGQPDQTTYTDITAPAGATQRFYRVSRN